MPQSAIAESCRQISFQVATAVLEQRSSTVPLHTKRTCGVGRVNKGLYHRKRNTARVEKTGEPADGETIRGRRKEPAVAKGQDARLHGQVKTAHASVFTKASVVFLCPGVICRRQRHIPLRRRRKRNEYSSPLNHAG